MTSYDPANLLEQFWMQDFSYWASSLALKSLTQSEKQFFIIPIIMCIEAIWATSSYPPGYPPKDIITLLLIYYIALRWLLILYLL